MALEEARVEEPAVLLSRLSEVEVVEVVVEPAVTVSPTTPSEGSSSWSPGGWAAPPSPPAKEPPTAGLTE